MAPFNGITNTAGPNIGLCSQNGACLYGNTTNVAANTGVVTYTGGYGCFGYSGTPYFYCNSLSSPSKSFMIEHPILPNKKLLHCCVESPRNDLLYRGIVQLIDGVEIVNIDSDCHEHPDYFMTEGTFVALARNPAVFLQNNDDFDRVIGKIVGNKLTIKCENINSNSFINWMVVAERQDDHFFLFFRESDFNFFWVTFIFWVNSHFL